MSAIILLLLISPAVGSFLGVLADRLPRGEDVILRPSACRSCGARLAAADLVPLLSFLWRRGRCGQCRAPIPPWLFYMELAATGLALLAVILATTQVEAGLIALFLWVLLGLVATDLLWFRLPDLLTGALLLITVAMAATLPWPGMESALWGAAIGAGGFWALRLGYKALRGREGLGMGDVKLMAGLGAALGPYDLPLMLLVATSTSLAVALAGRAQNTRALSPTRPLPFGAALAVATAFIWGLRQTGF